MASSISDYKHTQSSKRELSPSSSSITSITKKTRLDTLFDTSTQEEQVSDLVIGDDYQPSIGAQTPTFENRMGSFVEPGSGGYDRTPTIDVQAHTATTSMAHALLGIQGDVLDDIDEDDEDDDDDEYFNDAIDLDEKPYRRSLYSELVTSSNLPDDDDRRKSNLLSSTLFENEDEDEEGTTDFENKTTLPLSRSFAQRQHQTSFDEEVDRLFSSHNPADEPEFVLSSAAKLSILQQQHQHGPLWHTDKPHFLTDEYFQHHGPQDRSIPLDDKTPHTASIASYFDSQFERLGVMGSGEFARVLKARCTITNQLYAIKKSKNCFSGWDDRWLQLTEVDHLRMVKDSDHCVKMINAWEEKGYLYIQLELCSGGSLDTFIESKNRSIVEDQVWSIFHKLVLGINDIHAADIAHLDLKPSNILIDDQGCLKIADFGISVRTPVDARWVKGEGDRRYMAPDLLRENFDKPADIFSLGLILLELATGIVLPGTGESWEMLRLGDFSKQKEALSKLSLEMSEMIEWLLTTEAKERPTAHDIMQHPSFIKVQSTALEEGTLLSYVQEHAEMASNTPSRLSIAEANGYLN
ncbi:ER-derived vesicles protein erv46 [Mucor velutinosus]|uniref:ER-derived vesicles protein erv46 n=1 Tax=Mucor velutinosus TaxID=708070 RepID=A0AAN7D584_9FUNG|nr:ER-derived vesicles protein erv46 [Mucor velutinosus]